MFLSSSFSFFSTSLQRVQVSWKKSILAPMLIQLHVKMFQLLLRMQWSSSTPPFPQPMKKWSIMKIVKYPFMFLNFEYLQQKLQLWVQETTKTSILNTCNHKKMMWQRTFKTSNKMQTNVGWFSNAHSIFSLVFTMRTSWHHYMWERSENWSHMNEKWSGKLVLLLKCYLEY